MRVALAAIGIPAVGASAQAQVYHGNDTGGIISWSCENEAMAQQIAAEYCARWDKYHRITSVASAIRRLHCLQLPVVAAYRALCAAGGAHAKHLRL